MSDHHSTDFTEDEQDYWAEQAESLAPPVRQGEPDIFLCTKCGYVGETSSHEGCGYLAIFCPPVDPIIRGIWESLRGQNASLRARLSEAERDTKRLDWLDSQGENEHREYRGAKTTTVHDWREWYITGDTGSTLRRNLAGKEDQPGETMRAPKIHYSRKAKRTLCGLISAKVKDTSTKARVTCANCGRVLKAEAADVR